MVSKASPIAVVTMSLHVGMLMLCQYHDFKSINGLRVQCGVVNGVQDRVKNWSLAAFCHGGPKAWHQPLPSHVHVPLTGPVLLLGHSSGPCLVRPGLLLSLPGTAQPRGQ